jgi:hypothetical protein
VVFYKTLAQSRAISKSAGSCVQTVEVMMENCSRTSIPYRYIIQYDNCSAVASKQNRKKQAEQQRKSFRSNSQIRSLAKEALKSGNAPAANRNRFMAAVYGSMLDHS